MNKLHLLFAAVTIAVQLQDKTHVEASGSFQVDENGEPKFLVQKILVDEDTNEQVNLDQPIVVSLSDTQKNEFKSWASSVLQEQLALPVNATVAQAVATQAATVGAATTVDPSSSAVATVSVPDTTTASQATDPNATAQATEAGSQASGSTDQATSADTVKS